MSPSRSSKGTSPRSPESRPHIAEWFGHRVFPVVAIGADIDAVVSTIIRRLASYLPALTI